MHEMNNCLKISNRMCHLDVGPSGHNCHVKYLISKKVGCTIMICK